MRDVFVIMTGAYGNVGDGVIRRRILGWVRDAGQVHAYVGNAPADWVEQLGLRPDECVYPSSQAKRWATRLMFGRGRRALVFDPGQVPLGRKALKVETLYLLLTVWIRLRGGRVIRPPRAFAGKVNRGTVSMHRLACRISNVTLWRTPRSRMLMRAGQFCPDTAFQEEFVEGQPWDERNLVIVSMRGKRAAPSEAWFAGLTQVMDATGGRVVVVSQVREDETRSEEIAAALLARGMDSSYEAWGDRTDLAQELFIRSLYEEAKVVVSDRLHVLILAAKSGAHPIELTDQHPSKAEEHFSAIGYRGVSLLTSGDEVLARQFVSTSLTRRAELQQRMTEASSKLDEHSEAVRRLIS